MNLKEFWKAEADKLRDTSRILGVVKDKAETPKSVSDYRSSVSGLELIPNSDHTQHLEFLSETLFPMCKFKFEVLENYSVGLYFYPKKGKKENITDKSPLVSIYMRALIQELGEKASIVLKEQKITPITSEENRGIEFKLLKYVITQIIYNKQGGIIQGGGYYHTKIYTGMSEKSADAILFDEFETALIIKEHVDAIKKYSDTVVNNLYFLLHVLEEQRIASLYSRPEKRNELEKAVENFKKKAEQKNYIEPRYDPTNRESQQILFFEKSHIMALKFTASILGYKHFDTIGDDKGLYIHFVSAFKAAPNSIANDDDRSNNTVNLENYNRETKKQVEGKGDKLIPTSYVQDDVKSALLPSEAIRKEIKGRHIQSYKIIKDKNNKITDIQKIKIEEEWLTNQYLSLNDCV